MSSGLFYLAFGIALIVLIDPANGVLRGGKKEKMCIRIDAKEDTSKSDEFFESPDDLPTTDQREAERQDPIEAELKRTACTKNAHCCNGCSCKPLPASTNAGRKSTKTKGPFYKRISPSRSGPKYCTLNKNRKSCTEPRKSAFSKIRGRLPGGKGKKQGATKVVRMVIRPRTDGVAGTVAETARAVMSHHRWAIPQYRPQISPSLLLTNFL